MLGCTPAPQQTVGALQSFRPGGVYPFRPSRLGWALCVSVSLPILLPASFTLMLSLSYSRADYASICPRHVYRLNAACSKGGGVHTFDRPTLAALSASPRTARGTPPRSLTSSCTHAKNETKIGHPMQADHEYNSKQPMSIILNTLCRCCTRHHRGTVLWFFVLPVRSQNQVDIAVRSRGAQSFFAGVSK